MAGKITNFFIASEANNYQPEVLSYKAFVIYGAALLLLRLFLGTMSAAGAGVESDALMGLINQERGSRNVPTLQTSQKLLTAAAQKSEDMILRDYFAHIDPDGNYVWNRIVAAGYVPYKILGENLAVNFATSEGIMKAWLLSPKHRENLLNPEFVDQGLNAAYGDYQGRYTNLATSLFGALASGESDSTVKAAVKEPQAPPPAEPETQTRPEPASQPPAPSASLRGDSRSNPDTNEITKAPASFPLSPSSPQPPISLPAPGISALTLARVIFTLFGLFLLVILSIDAVIIYRQKLPVPRSHSSYHLFNFFFLVLVSVLIWWW